jgi:ubiquinol-cytochrome c reductase iron-sulfur subunit
MKVVEWRGKPVYIVRRTPQTIKDLDKLTNQLRDPNSENLNQQPAYVSAVARSISDELLVLIGLCTHLGCAPKYRPEVGAADLGGAEWLGGFFCPCHGSKFDLSGRVYKGVPAPTNLVVPPHSFESDDVIVIGVDQETA